MADPSPLDGLPSAHFQVRVLSGTSKALSLLCAECAQPINTVLTTAVALTLYRYAAGDSVVVLAQKGWNTDDGGSVIEISLNPSAQSTVRECVAQVAAKT